ncbi:3292_t:CDS:1, partial [Dentiscutata heterogama]
TIFNGASNSFIFSFTDQSNPVLSRIRTERTNKAIMWAFFQGIIFEDKRVEFWYKARKSNIFNSNELIAKEYGPYFEIFDLHKKDSNYWISD